MSRQPGGGDPGGKLIFSFSAEMLFDSGIVGWESRRLCELAVLCASSRGASFSLQLRDFGSDLVVPVFGGFGGTAAAAGAAGSPSFSSSFVSSAAFAPPSPPSSPPGIRKRRGLRNDGISKVALSPPSLLSSCSSVSLSVIPAGSAPSSGTVSMVCLPDFAGDFCTSTGGASCAALMPAPADGKGGGKGKEKSVDKKKDDDHDDDKGSAPVHRIQGEYREGGKAGRREGEKSGKAGRRTLSAAEKGEKDTPETRKRRRRRELRAPSCIVSMSASSSSSSSSSGTSSIRAWGSSRLIVPLIVPPRDSGMTPSDL
eukprot:scaffold228_cov312-Pinguiococcus_pyrenoidosus.AAC.34